MCLKIVMVLKLYIFKISLCLVTSNWHMPNNNNEDKTTNTETTVCVVVLTIKNINYLFYILTQRLAGAIHCLIYFRWEWISYQVWLLCNFTT